MAERTTVLVPRVGLTVGDYELYERPGGVFQLSHNGSTLLICDGQQLGWLAWLFDRAHMATEDPRLHPEGVPRP